LKLKKLYINNFLSYKEAEMDLENRGIVFIRGENLDTGGSNGAGKSTILEALVWTLFGETVRGVEKVDEVVNNITKRNCLCRLDLENDYTIIRTRKHKDHDNTLMLLHGSNNLSKPDVRITQKDINKLFNIDFDIFINSIVLAGSNVRTNFLDNKNNTLRRQVIENILGLDKFSDFLSITKDKIKDLESQKETLLNTISEAERHINSYNDKIAELNYRRDNFDKEKQDRIVEFNTKIERLSKIDHTKQLEIHQKLNAGNEILSKIKSSIQSSVSSISELESKCMLIDKEIIKYKNKDSVCKYCGSELDNLKLERIISNLNKEREDFQTQISTNKVEVKKYQDTMTEIENSIADVKPDLSERELYNLEANLKLFKDKLYDLQASEFQDVNFDADIERLSKLIKTNNQKITLIEQEWQYYKFWELGFGNKGLKTYILEDMLQYLNRKIEFYLNILSKGQIHLIFDKYLDFEISGLNYRNCSSGERKRVDLAVLVALYDLTNLRHKSNYNILILDEVLDSIDEIGVEAAKELLMELNKRIPTIFVISHNNALSEYFSDSITVVKENGISKVL
jgi:DNA repair exonuclease SbcCD ATPase subunit